MTVPEKILRHEITGVVLAGGRARRLGGIDKGLLALRGRPMVAHVLARLYSQVGSLLIVANRNREDYAALGVPVVADFLPDYPGPLAGFAAGMRAATTPYVVTVPCDAPQLHPELVRRLGAALLAQQAELCVAHDGERIQPTFALLKRTLLPNLFSYLACGGRRVENWCRQQRLALANFRDCPEAFLNINEPADYLRFEPEATLPRQWGTQVGDAMEEAAH